MQNVGPSSREPRGMVPACPEHAGQAAVSTEDTTRLVTEAGVWLWRRTSWRITYACGCRLELCGVPTINEDHPLLSSQTMERPTADRTDEASGRS